MKLVIVLAILIFALTGSVARAQVVVTYDSFIVTSDSESIPVGERVVISYVLDSVPDMEPDPLRGIYADPVVAMWVSFPDLELYANCGPGTSLGDALAQTSNNLVSPTGVADGALFSCGQVTESTPIDGNLVRHIDIEFDDVVGPGIEPTMLSSDALPLNPLSTQFSYLMISTAGPGFVFLKFAPPTTPVTLSYEAVVTSALGPHAALFPAGERIQITYTLSQNAIDRNTDPTQANYRNALLGLNVTFPGLDIFANGGPPRDWADGQAYIANDTVFPSGAQTDQVHLWADPVASTTSLNGEAVSFFSLNFEDFPAAPAPSTMLSSDALPLTKLRASDPYISFHTSSGNTFVNFALAPSEQIRMLTDDVNSLVTAGTIPAGAADRLIRSLQSAAASIAKNNTGSACSHLRAFVRRVEDEIAAGTLSAAVGQTLLDHAETLQNQLGC